MKNSLIAALMSVLAVFALVGTAAAHSTSGGSYTTAAVNLRTGPSKGYHVIKTIPKGAYVAVHHCSGSWCKVTAKRRTGWMSRGYIGSGHHHYSKPKPKYKKWHPKPGLTITIRKVWNL